MWTASGTGAGCRLNPRYAFERERWGHRSRTSGFAIPGRNASLRPMPRKPIELPPEVARAFVADMRAFHAAKDSLTKDEIAAKQLWLLKQHGTASCTSST